MSLTMQTFLSNPHKYLNNFVRQMDREDVPTIEALLIDLLGSDIAYRMLNRLLVWWKRSVRNGWVWKSWKDWNRECRISRNQRDRVHREKSLESVGVEQKTMQVASHGTPVHYRLNWNDFVQALADFACIPFKQALAWLAGKRTPYSPAPACVETKQAIQEPTSNSKQNKENTDNNKADVVVIPDMKPDLIRSLIDKYGEKRVLEMKKYAERTKAKNFIGFLLRGLAEEWIVPPEKNRFGQIKTGETWADWADY